MVSTEVPAWIYANGHPENRFLEDNMTRNSDKNATDESRAKGGGEKCQTGNNFSACFTGKTPGLAFI